MESFINIALWVAIIMVVVAALAAIVLPLINSMSHPKSLLKTGIGIVVMLVLFLISWAIADNEVTARYIDFGVNESSSKLVGGCLILMYILFIGTVIGVIYSELNKALK